MGSTALGISTKEGVLLAVEKRVTSPLMEASSIEKILEIDSHIGLSPWLLPHMPPAVFVCLSLLIGCLLIARNVADHPACAMSGLTADSRTMIDRARVEAQNYWFTYNELMPVESVVQSVCNLAMQFSEGDEAEEHTMVWVVLLGVVSLVSSAAR